MKIEYVTHASLFLKSNAANLLLDPFYWFDATSASIMVHYPPRDLRPEGFGSIRYVYSSHVHPDHSHPETLSRLKDRIQTVLLPDERVLLAERYRHLGFSDIVTLQNGKTVKLDEGFEVTAYWSDPVDTCLIARLDGKTILHLNDCLPDEETVRRIAQRHRVDYAFVLYTSAQDLYPFLLPRSEAELQALALEREENFLHAQLRRIDLLQPRVVVPYSMTMTYVQPDQIRLNGYHRLIPPQFRQRLAAHSPGLQCWVLQPGDVIDAAEDAVIRFRDENLWGDTLDEYIARVEAYSHKCRSVIPPFRWGDADALHESLWAHLNAGLDGISAAYLRLLLPHPVIALHVRGDTSARAYIVDLEQNAVSTGLEGMGSPAPFVEITMPSSLAQLMVDGFYDPFSLLFSHRFSFKCNSDQPLPPTDENQLYITVTVCLLCPNPQDHICL